MRRHDVDGERRGRHLVRNGWRGETGQDLPPGACVEHTLPRFHLLCRRAQELGPGRQCIGAREISGTDSTLHVVRERCKPTPFLHALLSSGKAAHVKRFVCIPCVNWKRRVEHVRARPTAVRPMLQLDRMILFLMQPGRHQEPDMRCMERLVRAVRQPENPYRAAFPPPVQWIVSRIQGDTYQHCVLAWWEYNGRTEFFASAQEARRVRCALKAGLDGPKN